jgi:oligopeptide transport system permease protein
VLGSILIHLGSLNISELVDAKNIFSLPGGAHWLGTDSMGRDLFFRILKGSGTSLLVAASSILISTILALVYGSVSGWFGGRVDWVLMVILDVWMSLPSSVLAIVIAMLLVRERDSLILVSVVIGLTHWGRLARIVRSEVEALRNREFVVATKIIGASNLQIMRSHLVPHLLAVVETFVIYQFPNYILAESFLSFVGLGVQPPNTSWGILIQDGWRSLQVFPHVVLAPALFLSITILSLKLLFLNAEKLSQ